MLPTAWGFDNASTQRLRPSADGASSGNSTSPVDSAATIATSAAVPVGPAPGQMSGFRVSPSLAGHEFAMGAYDWAFCASDEAGGVVTDGGVRRLGLAGIRR
jgi:hypothetical protein